MSTMPLVTTEAIHSGEPGFLQRVFHRLSRRVAATRERLIVRETLMELRELDEFMLHDIGVAGEDIYRLHRLRNRRPPTLSVG